MPRARQFAVRVAVTTMFLLLLLEVLSHAVFIVAFAPSLSSGDIQIPRGPCAVSVVSNTPFVAVGECRNWIIGEVYDAELRINGPGGMQHWSVAAMRGDVIDTRVWTGPPIRVEYGGEYTVALVLDGQVVAETGTPIYMNGALGSNAE